jgi:hypothetical protein
MGGIGSGRRYQDGKDTTEDSRPLDIRKIKRSGLLLPGCSFGWQWTINDRPIGDIRIRVQTDHVVLTYRHRPHSGAEWEDVWQPVYLDHTSCHLGGERSWWVCPICGRRVAVLYGPGKHYACRHCRQLAYASQREKVDDRAARRADRIRRRLGWHVGILNPKGGKPKGMHWRTFERLETKHDAFANVSMTGMMQRFGLMNRRLDKLGLEPLDDLGWGG